MRLFFGYLIGLIFGVGIALSGMANPAKVINFFDFAGTWDPSLVFVMGGAVITTFIGYRLVLARPAPVFETSFQLPTNRKLDRDCCWDLGFLGLAVVSLVFAQAVHCLRWALGRSAFSFLLQL